MGYTISGQLVDSNNKPLEFAVIYTSDSSGKPMSGSKNTQSDDKGKWSLNGIEDTDYITARMVGYNQNTFSAKSIIPVSIMGVPKRLVKKILKEDSQTTLSDVPISAKRVIKKENKLGKYIALSSLGVALFSTFILLLNKK